MQLGVNHRSTSANELFFTQTKPMSVFCLVLSWGALLEGECPECSIHGHSSSSVSPQNLIEESSPRNKEFGH